MPFRCSYCDRVFNRQEHLNRHIRSHTAERPYVCTTCSKAFTRIDLLNRHAQSHSTVSLESKKREREKEFNGRSVLPRSKVACDSCAKAKVKCSGDVPCENCLKKAITCHVRNSKVGAMNVEGRIASLYSEIPLSEVIGRPQAQAASNIIPSPPLSGVQNSRFDLFDTFGDEIEADNFFLGIIDGFDSSVRDIREALELPTSVIEPNMTPVFANTIKPSEQINQLVEETPLPIADLLCNDYHRQNQSVPKKKIFDTSPLVWRPAHDDHKRGKQMVSSLQLSEVNTSSTLSIAVADSSRDAVIVMVSLALQIYAPNVKPTFPPLSAFNFFLSSFFKSALQLGQVLHRASFDPNRCEPILLATMIAVGALLQGTEIKGAQIFGLGMLELTRLALDYLVETDNTLARHIEIIQAYKISSAAASWTGSKRTMELAEAHRSTSLTMIRRADWFKNSDYRALNSILNDNTMSLQGKWEAWRTSEGQKRVAFYSYIWEMELSIFFNVSPSLHYAQFVLPLPHSKNLWEAVTAEDWYTIALKEVWHIVTDGPNLSRSRERSFTDYLQTFFATLEHSKGSDSFLDYLVLMALCQHVIDLRRSADVREFHGSEHTERLNWHNLQSTDLNHTLTRWLSGIGEMQRDVNVTIFYHVCQLHLHASIDAIETLAGKEDQVESRRVLPGLLAWVSKESSRAAVWHSSQIIRYAEKGADLWIPVAVYQAALVLWAYGILGLKHHGSQEVEGSNYVSLCQERSKVVDNFIQFGWGKPAYILDHVCLDLENSTALLEMCIEIMANTRGSADMITNLCKLLGMLGSSSNALLGNCTGSLD